MQVIDKSSWERKEIFDFFSPMSNPFFSITFPLDVTDIYNFAKANKLSFYYTMCWACTKAMNSVDAFLYKIRGNDIVKIDSLIPSFTALRKGTDNFFIVTVDYCEDVIEFCERCRLQEATQKTFVEACSESDELIYITCQPWFDVTGFVNERNLDPNDSVPRVCWGKYEENEKGRKILHMSLEVNHKLIDGVHISHFYNHMTNAAF